MAGAYWQGTAYAQKVAALAAKSAANPIAVAVIVEVTSTAPTLVAELVANEQGLLTASPAFPSIESGFSPVSGSGVIYSEGSVLKIA